MANNQNYSRGQNSSPLTKEEFFASQSRGRVSYRYETRTEGSLAAQPEPVRVPQKRPPRPRTEEELRRRQSEEQRRRPQTRRTQPKTEEELRRERIERRRRIEEMERRKAQDETARLRRSSKSAAKEAEGKDKAEKTNAASSSEKHASRTNLRGKFGFFLSTAIILAGCMMIVFSYVRLYNKNVELASLKRELTSVQETNKVAQQRQADTMNMNELYSYAVDTLGMVEADVDTIIKVTIVNQSYTTSNLPVSEIGESKVTYHWWFRR